MSETEEPLRVRVARAMGCEPYQEFPGWECGCSIHAPQHCRAEDMNILPYDTDETAAFRAVAWMVGKRWGCHVRVSPAGCFAVFYNGKKKNGWFPAEAATPAEAICRALLKACECELSRIP